MFKHKLFTITLIISTAVYLTINGLNKKNIDNQPNNPVYKVYKSKEEYKLSKTTNDKTKYQPKIYNAEEFKEYISSKSLNDTDDKDENSDYIIYNDRFIVRPYKDFDEKKLTDKDEIKLLKKEIKTLKSSIINLEETLKNLSADVHCKRFGIFNAKNLDGYNNIETECGIFPVSIKEVKPYLKGHKITFSIGNPHYAKHENYKIKIRFSLKEEIQEKEFFSTKPLCAGKWTDIECFINPSTLDELELFILNLEISGTTLIEE